MKPLYFVFVSFIAVAGCTDSTMSNEDRVPLGKADNFGSCEEACGGQSDGSCWCDDLCDFFGDCCDDLQDFCPDTCNINPGTVFCIPDHVFDVKECACVPIEKPEPECAAQDAVGVGTCELFMGFAWNGESCDPIGGCDCVGEDCGNLRFSEQECLDAGATCEFDCPINPNTVFCAPGHFFSVEECACVIPKTCAEVGGTCRSSQFDVTFPADCEGEFGETTNFEATCEAFNQVCCM